MHNLTMPGLAGLDGTRTYTAADGSAEVGSADSGTIKVKPGPRVDTLALPRSSCRHVRMQGVSGHPQYGYSLYTFGVTNGEGGPDLARGRTATASSAATGYGAERVLDGDASTRWAVAVGERSRQDSWLSVDLGSTTEFDHLTLAWESAAATAYRVQGSDDGKTWTDLARFPEADLTSRGGWLSVDGRAGLVVRGGGNPLAVYGDVVILSDGPAEAVTVEGHPNGDPADVKAAASRRAPLAQDPVVHASTVGGHLSLFNLSSEPVNTVVSVPGQDDGLHLYAGFADRDRRGNRFQSGTRRRDGRDRRSTVHPAYGDGSGGPGRCPGGCRRRLDAVAHRTGLRSGRGLRRRPEDTGPAA